MATHSSVTDSLLLNSLHPIFGCADWFSGKHTSPPCNNLGGDTTRVQITKKVHSGRGLEGASGTAGGKCGEWPAETEGQRHLMLAAGPGRLGPEVKLLQAQLPPHWLSPDSTERDLTWPPGGQVLFAPQTHCFSERTQV